MGKPTHHDLNYFKQRITSRHSEDPEDLERTIGELQEIVRGINKGVEVLARLGKYPDDKMLENKKGFEEVLERYLALKK